MAAGFKTIGYCPSADAIGATVQEITKAAQFVIKKISERPDKCKIVRTTRDIDEAIKEKKLGIYFIHQGTALFEGEPDRVGFWR